VFAAETWKLWGCGELRTSARNRAISLSVKPTGTGGPCRKSGTTAGGEEDGRWSVTIATPGSPIAKGCCSVEIPKSWFASKEYGSKGVTIICGPAYTESVEKIDLGLERLHLRRRSTKVTIPITAKMAATPPIIAPISLFCVLGDRSFVALIVCTGAL
jgi:hypothetical protein